ncbi:MAG: PG0541 family transporter-associated protein [Nitrospirota bacterium]
MMKMFVIVYSSSCDDSVMEAITRGGIKAYTKWGRVLGKGTETRPKLTFSQGDNDVLSIVVDDKDAKKLKEIVVNLRKENPIAGIRCFIMPVEEMI